MKTKIICVVGATASGKTALSVALAQRLNGEIISADSMQVYRGMGIATAAATKEEQQGVPHHLLAFLEPDTPFSVAEFVRLAKEKIAEITARGRVPIVVGGTGLFVDSLVQNITFSDIGADEALRKRLETLSDERLYDELQRVDASSAAAIHPHNRKRVIRALELYYGGVSKTQQNAASRLRESPYEALYIGIGYRDRQVLYNRINRRVQLMAETGLVQEAKTMLQRAGTTAAQAIGHKELQPYLEGSISLEQALDSLQKATRHYAKRQLTWFRRNESIHWLYADETDTNTLTDTAEALCRAFLAEDTHEKA